MNVGAPGAGPAVAGGAAAGGAADAAPAEEEKKEEEKEESDDDMGFGKMNGICLEKMMLTVLCYRSLRLSFLKPYSSKIKLFQLYFAHIHKIVEFG
jgi:hypothetical protein